MKVQLSPPIKQLCTVDNHSAMAFMVTIQNDNNTVEISTCRYVDGGELNSVDLADDLPLRHLAQELAIKTMRYTIVTKYAKQHRFYAFKVYICT